MLNINMANLKLCAIIFTAYVAICNGESLHTVTQRNVDFRDGLDENIDLLKSCDAFELIGEEFVELYDFTENRVNHLYDSVDDSIYDVIEMYEDIIEQADELTNAFTYGISEEMESYTDKIKTLTDLNKIAQDTKSSYPKMNEWLKNMGNENNKIISNLNRMVQRFYSDSRRNENSLEIFKRQIPSENVMSKKINAGITSMSSSLKLGVNMFEKHMRETAEDMCRSMNSSIMDKHAMKALQLNKLNEFKNMINLKYHEALRKVNQVNRITEDYYDKGIAKLEGVEQKFVNSLSKLQQNFIEQSVPLKHNIKLMQNFSTAVIYEVNPSGEVELERNSHIPYYGKMRNELLVAFSDDIDGIEYKVSGRDHSGNKYMRTFQMTADEDGNHVTEEYEYYRDGTIQKKNYIFQQ